MKQLNFAFELNSKAAPAIAEISNPENPPVKTAFKAKISHSEAAIPVESKIDEGNILSFILLSLLKEYFPTRLDLHDYKISWSSRRQKRTLASCNLKGRKILVAQELKHPDYRQFLWPLIYHELCHAVLGYTVHSKQGKSRWHGKEFRLIEKQHPEIILLNKWIKEGGWRQAVRRHRGRTSSKLQRKITLRKPIRSSLISRLFKNLGLR